MVLDVKPSETIHGVKVMIKERGGSEPENQRLEFDQKLLKGERTLTDHNIGEGSKLMLYKLVSKSETFQGGMQIFVKTLCAKFMEFRPESCTTIGELKCLIQDIEGIPADNQRLYWSRIILQDEKTLAEYNIPREAVLNIVLQLRGYGAIYGTNSMILDVKPSDTINAVKTTIKEAGGLDTEKQRLEYEEQVLEDERTLADYSIQKNAHILSHDLDRPINIDVSMQVFVKTLNGTTVTAEIKPSDTILTLKECIHALNGMPIDQQRMVFAGVEVENDRTFADYGIAKESTFHLVIRLRGCDCGCSSRSLGNDGKFDLDQ
ncbi:Polyubiqutin 1 [Tothia fuscella]|uniref:Polyubiqutin 1 n=1 Tax=Tothia fuscella TaxID=1048955 RepID=A0A9P4NQP1_9PEZI|nr:Polyubiqutin 1 [Tothia fuscella]